MMNTPALPDKIASSLEETEKRHRSWVSNDPLPDVPPSLLSQIEIEKYCLHSGMIFPFCSSRLKTSSYEGRIGQRIFFFDHQGQRQELATSNLSNNFLCIKANSILFVESDITFYLPLYIGVRFNLQIIHVHRGLLLGTGPLVDPGFSGKILIPLHNLTSADHYISTQEGLIWVEFTKTTYKHENDPDRRVKFPTYKKDKDSEYWLNKAARNSMTKTSVPIETSIPKAITDAQDSAKIAIDTKKFVSRVGWLAIAGLLFATFVFYDTYFRATLDKVHNVEQNILGYISAYEDRHLQIMRELEALRVDNEWLKERALGSRDREGASPAAGSAID